MSCIPSFIHWFIQTQFLGASSAVPGAVGELGVTWSPILDHSPLGDWLERVLGVRWTRAASQSRSREAGRVRVSIASLEDRARACCMASWRRRHLGWAQEKHG